MSAHQISLINHSGQTIGLLTSSQIVRLKYRQKLNLPGALTLSVYANDAPIGLTDFDNILLVYRQKEAYAFGEDEFELNGAYLIHSKAYMMDDSGEQMLVVGGIGLEELLNRRILRPQDDPFNVPLNTGYITKGGPADTLMNELVEEQCISPAVNTERALPGLTVSPSSGAAPAVAMSERISNRKVIDQLKAWTYQSGYDFRIVYTGNATFEFQSLVIGTDRTRATNFPGGAFTFLSPQSGNISDPELSIDASKESNVIVVLGDGERVDVLEIVREGITVDESPWSRREHLIVSGGDNLDTMTTTSYETLNEFKRLTEFKCRPIAGRPNVKIGIDLFLGDKITIGFRDYQGDVRVSDVEYTIESGTEDILITLEAYQA